MAVDFDTGELVERGSELGLLARVLDAAQKGRGTVVVIEGEPGVGKSALAARAGELAVRRGFSLLSAAARASAATIAHDGDSSPTRSRC